MRILLFIHISKDQHLPIFKHRNTLLKVITSTNVKIILLGYNNFWKYWFRKIDTDNTNNL